MSKDIECLLSTPLVNTPSSAMAVVCHPHPLYGGTLHNKVVTIMAKILIKHNMPVLRFNFRGVELSQGVYDNGVGEKEDLAFVSQFMHERYPEQALWLAGFSFGAYIAASMQHRLQAEQLITIAPAVTSFDFDQFPAPQCPWLLIQGLADEVIDADKVLRWANSLEKPPTIETMEETSHFFHRRLVDLGKILEQQLFNETS